jgi:hypothetical protein
MKKYSTLQCSTCKRTRDQLINLTHYAPDKCTITLNCEGRLYIIGNTDAARAVLSIPPTGLSNWHPRGATITTNFTLAEDLLYDTSTGNKKQVILAVSNTALGFTPGSQAVLTLNLIAEQQTAKDFRQYTYRRSTPFTTINGVEDAQGKKVLRYNIVGLTPDVVEVYVNGVKRDLGIGIDDYQLNDGTINSPVPPNSVLFNTLITGSSTQIDIIVTKAASISSASLVFNRVIDDESRIGIGAWEDINFVSSPALNSEYSLFYCDFSEIGTSLGVDVKLRISPSMPSYIVNVPLGPSFIVTDASILLSRTKLYTQIDRQRALWVPISLLNTNTEYLIVKLIDEARTLLVTESAKKNIFPVLEVHRFNTRKLQTDSFTGDSDAAELDNDIIIGPDA